MIIIQRKRWKGKGGSFLVAYCLVVYAIWGESKKLREWVLVGRAWDCGNAIHSCGSNVRTTKWKQFDMFVWTMPCSLSPFFPKLEPKYWWSEACNVLSEVRSVLKPWCIYRRLTRRVFYTHALIIKWSWVVVVENSAFLNLVKRSNYRIPGHFIYICKCALKKEV